MNTKVSVSKSIRRKDNGLFLADKKNLTWLADYFTPADIHYITKTAKSNISYAFVPGKERLCWVQFLNLEDDDIGNKEAARLAGNEVLTSLSHYKVPSVTVVSHCAPCPLLEYVEGMVLGNYQFLKYLRSTHDRNNHLREIRIVPGGISRKEIDHLNAVMEATYIARNLVNEPLSHLTATAFSSVMKSLGKQCGFSVKVFNKKKIEQMKMGGILAVNKGSVQPPSFNIVEWKPPKANNKKPVVLVGKGIVYDTGGMSLKPTPNSMDKMKCDMAGAATVLGAVVAAAKAKLPIHLIALIPATDNRPAGDAYVPGDVITMYDGTTVEVLNTDAEGRLVLADALHYAKKYRPELVLDFATLTGAAAYACGPEAICYMGNAPKTTKEKMEESGRAVHERLIAFPLWKEYGEHLKSNVADLKNIGGTSAGMITAGKFLEHFVDYQWMHFDIAGPAFLKAADGYRPKDGTGVGVRLLFDFFKNY